MIVNLTDDEVEELQNAMYAYLLSFSMANHPGKERLAVMESAALKIGMVDGSKETENDDWWAGGRLGG